MVDAEEDEDVVVLVEGDGCIVVLVEGDEEAQVHLEGRALPLVHLRPLGARRSKVKLRSRDEQALSTTIPLAS